MKRLTISLIIGLISCIVFAQVPNTFSYQAVVRNSVGEPLAYQQTNFRISLLLGSDTGPVSFQETHLQTTNFFGLVNLEIGNGTVVTGVFDTLSWSSKSYYIKVEADISGGSNFIALGTTQLLAVPYALHAEDAASSSRIQDQDGDTKIDTEENPDEDIIRFYTGGQEQVRMMNKRMEIINPDRNIFIGERSGESNTGGVDNVFFGRVTGKYNTTGSENVFIGDSAGSANIDGTNNTFVGAWSGALNTTGICNAFFGADAGERNQTGTRNAFLGYGTGYTSTGSRNTFVGSHAGMYNQAGSYNTFVGQAAGIYNSGDGSVFIGKSAGQNESGSNKLYISNSSTAEPLIYGEFDNQKLHFNANEFLIGQSNQILSLSDNVVLGRGAGFTNGQTGPSSNNVYIGQNAGYSDTESDNNVFLGAWSGYKNTTSRGNVFLGASAGQRNTTGSGNTYLGYTAGRQNMTGQGNVFIGYFAGRNELGSGKLYIANSETSQPLIYGDFTEKQVRMWADDLLVEGKTSSRDGFNADGDDGICDTLFAITSFDFANQKIKFRKQVIKGGITIELTGESAWMDSINKQYLFCDDGLTDARDGRQYQTVLIGDQCWMAENLNVGTRIDGNSDASDNGIIEKYCYGDSEANCTTWGGLYGWNELMQYKTTPGTQGVCPKGWHVPTDEEFKILEGNVDSQYGLDDPEWDLTGWRGFDAGLNLKAMDGWTDGGNGSDAFGFHALPGGNRTDGSVFYGSDSVAWFWLSSSDLETPYCRLFKSGYNEINRHAHVAGCGFSLRCIKGEGIDLPTVTTMLVRTDSESTATGGGNVTDDGGAPVIARGVVWSTSENPTLADSFTTDGAGTGEFTSNLTDLADDESYYVRAYATNSAGTAYGDQVGFTTRGDPCPGIPSVEWQGQTYHTVMVGAQCWLKENLNVGSMVHIALNQTNNNVFEKYCYLNDPVNCTKFGGLYQWDEAMQYSTQQSAQGICPDGWHIPSDDEWKVLEGFADSQYEAGDPIWENKGFRGFDAGKNLKSISGWQDNGNGTDLYGFTVLATGFALAGNIFVYLNSYSAMWSSTEIQGTGNAWDRGLYHLNDGLERWDDSKSGYGESIRCLNNQTGLPTVTTASVSNVTDISATSGGNITDDGGSAITVRGVVWSTSEYPTLNDNHTTDGAGTGEFVSAITGLTASTQYYVRAYATNTIGTGYGNQLLFTSGGASCPGTPSVIYEGQTYHTVLIADQCWLAENLNVGTMIDGSLNQTDNGSVEKYCYDNDPENCGIYGALYQWNEAMQYSTIEGSQGICPAGWHIPTDQELKTLEGTVDTQYGVGDPVWDEAGCRGNDAGIHLKSFAGWPEWCEGDNLSGFNYLHAPGYRQTDGTFLLADGGSPLWSSSQYNGNSSWPRAFPCHMGGLCRDYDDNRLGWSVRCIKNF